MEIVYGTGAYRRLDGNLPELRLVNMYLEAATTSNDGKALLSRKGLTEVLTTGTSRVRGLFYQSGVFGGDLFSASGSKLYREDEEIGSLTGSGQVTFASGAADELAVCANGILYKYDGTTLAPVSLPDGMLVRSVRFHDGRYIVIKKDSDEWYWSNVYDLETWEALSFATAEASPDVLYDIRALGDFLFLMGAATIEKWANTGNPDAPYTRIEGSVFRRGILTDQAAVEDSDGIYFVSSDGGVYRLTDELSRISDHGLEERIAASNSVSTFVFRDNGHVFVCLRLNGATFVYDTITGQWSEFATYGRNNWRAACAVNRGLKPVFGDDSTGTVWEFGGWTDAGAPLERVFTAAIPIPDAVVVVNNLILNANVGRTPLLEGQGSQPTIEMRMSRTAGALWSPWQPASLGATGEYRTRARWTRCGMFDYPGAMFEFRLTDPVPFRVAGVGINNPGGGRSR